MFLVWVATGGWVLATAAVQSALWRGGRLRGVGLLMLSALVGVAAWGLVHANGTALALGQWCAPIAGALAFTFAAEALRALSARRWGNPADQ